MTQYNYEFLKDALVKIKDMGLDGQKLIDEDVVDSKVLSNSVTALKNLVDADIFNENSPLGKQLKDFYNREYQRLAQIDKRIEEVKDGNK